MLFSLETKARYLKQKHALALKPFLRISKCHFQSQFIGWSMSHGQTQSHWRGTLIKFGTWGRWSGKRCKNTNLIFCISESLTLYTIKGVVINKTMILASLFSPHWLSGNLIWTSISNCKKKKNYVKYSNSLSFVSVLFSCIKFK